MTKKIKVLFFFLIFLSTSLHAASTCDLKTIKFYLDNNFSPTQITLLCQPSQPGSISSISSTPSKAPVYIAPAPLAAVIPTPINPVTAQHKAQELFFNRAIAAKQVNLLKSSLVYIADECIRYGVEDEHTGFRPKVCTPIKTTIQLKDLEIVSTSNGFSFLSESELIVKGNIKRELVAPETLSEEDKSTMDSVFDNSPEKHQIILREDADPDQVANALTYQ